MKSKIDHRSPRRFSTGVPVSAMRAGAFSALTARVCLAPGFLIACASSRMTKRHVGLRQRRHAQQRAVAGDHQVELRRRRRREPPDLLRGHRRGMHDQRVQLGREVLDLRRPVRQQRRRRHQQARPSPRALAAACSQQQRQHLDRLAQPHVVGQAGAEAEPGQQMQPLHAGLLIRPQRRRAAPARDRLPAPSGARSALQRLRQPRAGRHARPVGDRRHPRASSATAAPASIRIASAKRQAVSRRQLLGLAGTARIARSQPLAIDLDPLAAQQHQPVGAGEQRRDLRVASASRRRA